MHALRHTRRSLIAGATATTVFASSIRPSLAAPKVINWWYEGATAEQQAALDRYLTQPFNASQSTYKLVIEYRGSALPDQLLVALAGGQGPDIVLTNAPHGRSASSPATSSSTSTPSRPSSAGKTSSRRSCCGSAPMTAS
jgi:ABC-type glycerol-3-phosphate transport system substrate-binding protein